MFIFLWRLAPARILLQNLATIGMERWAVHHHRRHCSQLCCPQWLPMLCHSIVFGGKGRPAAICVIKHWICQDKNCNSEACCGVMFVDLGIPMPDDIEVDEDVCWPSWTADSLTETKKAISRERLRRRWRLSRKRPSVVKWTSGVVSAW